MSKAGKALEVAAGALGLGLKVWDAADKRAGDSEERARRRWLRTGPQLENEAAVLEDVAARWTAIARGD